MAARYFDPDEDDLFERIEQRVAQFSRYKDSTPAEQAANVNALAAAYKGTLAPGVIYSLGRAGIKPDSPEAARAVGGSQKKKGFLDSVGDAVSGAAAAALGAAGGVADEGYDVLKGVSRGAFSGLGSVKQGVDATFRENDEDGLQLGDFNPTKLIPQIAAATVGEQTELGQGVRAIGESFKPGGRAPFKGLDYGSGFFTGGEVKDRTTQAQLKASGGFTVDGRPRVKTIGRGIASKVVEDEGSKRYNILSGLTDASLVIASDPSTYFGGGTAQAIRGSRNLTGSADTVARTVGDAETPAKAKARVFGAGQATAAEYAEDAIRYGADNPKVRDLVDRFNQGLITKGELASELPRLRNQIKVDAGLLNASTRNVSIPERGAAWLDSGGGTRTVNWLAKQTDFNTIWKATGKKLPVTLVDDLTRANDPMLVKSVLADVMNNGQLSESFGVKLGAQSDLWTGAVGRIKPDKGYYRLAQRVPGQKLELGDPDDLVNQADLYMRNANLPEDVISGINSSLVQATRNGRPAVFEAAKGMFKAIENDLVTRQGIPRGVATGFTRAFDTYMDDAKYFTDELAQDMYPKQVTIGNKVIDAPSPHQLNEFINRNIPLPDVRAIKKASGNPLVKRLLDEETKLGKPGFYSNEIADFVQNQVWTPLRLLRGAFVIRNIAEAQGRMAVGGYDNAFTSPLDFLAWAVGSDSRTGERLARLGTGRGEYDATGQLIRQTKKTRFDANGNPVRSLSETAQGADAFTRSLQRGGSKYGSGEGAKDIKLVPGSLAVVQNGDPRFARAWGAELSKIATDDVQQIVLRDGVDVAKEKFFGSAAHKELQESEGFMQNFGSDKAGADRYIDSLDERINVKTGGSPELREALRQWRLGGKSLFKGDVINPDFIAKLDDFMDLAPAKVIGPREIRAGQEQANLFRQVVDAGFELLATRPENWMNNSPVMNQAYWRRMSDFTEYLTKADQQTLLDNARKSKMPADMIAKIEKRMALRSGDVTITDASEFAARRALQDQKKLLYTAADKTQFFDAARAVFVFGDALRNTAVTWTRLFSQNPVSAYRGGLGVQGLRDTDPNGDGVGFFTRDPQTGQEVYVTPGTGMAIKALTGVETGGFKSPVSGLNLLGTSVIPSLGPVTGYAAGKLLPDTADWDGIRNAVFPFGEPDTIVDVAPPWLNKMLTGTIQTETPGNKAKLASATAEVFRYNLSTGKYDIANPQDVEDAMQDSIDQAKRLFFIRGAFQFWSPSAPTPRFMQYDKDGKLQETFEFVRVFGELYEENPETATKVFIERYGELALGAAVGKTEALGTAPANKKALQFAKDNDKVVKRYKEVYGLFLSSEGDFDLKAYTRQQTSGERETKDPEVFVNEVRERIARSLLDKKKEQLGYVNNKPPTDEAAAEVREFKSILNRDMQFVQGFDTGKAARTITRIQEAVGDPALAELPAGKAAAAYLTARDRVIAEATRRGVADFSQNQKTADLREYLREVGKTALGEYPEFGNMWERVFQRELGDD